MALYELGDLIPVFVIVDVDVASTIGSHEMKQISFISIFLLDENFIYRENVNELNISGKIHINLPFLLKELDDIIWF